MSRQKVFILQKRFYFHPVFSNYAASRDSEIINVKTNRIMKMHSGYCQLLVYDKKLFKPKRYLQHRFVNETIKGLIPEGLEIIHINAIKTDNRIKNLELVTHKKDIELLKNKPIISINIYTGEENNFISIETAAIELDICASNISDICTKNAKQQSPKTTVKSTDLNS